jgi:hypothetical protein
MEPTTRTAFANFTAVRSHTQPGLLRAIDMLWKLRCRRVPSFASFQLVDRPVGQI